MIECTGFPAHLFQNQNKQNSMEQDKMNGRSASEQLQTIVDEYVEFACHVLHNEDILVALDKMTPFDETAQATKQVDANGMGIETMGLAIMRMDFEPNSYSLGITVEVKDADGHVQEHISFLEACKTVEELQMRVEEESFKEDVFAIFADKVSRA